MPRSQLGAQDQSVAGKKGFLGLIKAPAHRESSAKNFFTA